MTDPSPPSDPTSPPLADGPPLSTASSTTAAADTPPPPRRRFRESLFAKATAIAGLVFLLWIPLLLEQGLVEERRQRQQEASGEVSRMWGGPQVVAGMVLAVPFDLPPEPLAEATGARPIGAAAPLPQRRSSTAYFTPRDLEVDIHLVPEVRRRGIFETVVYTAEVNLQGSFDPVELGSWEMAPEDLRWEWATVRFSVLDDHGLRGAELLWDGEARELTPGGSVSGLWSSGLVARVAGADPAGWDAAPFARHRFELRLTLLGSGVIEVLPLARSSVVSMRSTWTDPSFRGTLLPDSREIGTAGFAAQWNLPELMGSRQDRWLEGKLSRPRDLVTEREAAILLGQMGNVVENFLGEPGVSSVGVALDVPVDHYRMTERSVKYGLLIVLLTFVTVFLLEVMGRVPLHAMHYLLVGAAVVLFYLLLLSLSEHVPFAVAYLVAAVAVVTLVTAYAAAILGGWRRAGVLGGVLSLLYVYLWGLLAAEDYALLFGSVGLFTILALIMFLTRRVDWWSPSAVPRNG